MADFLEPTGEDINVTTTPSTTFDEPVGEEILDQSVTAEAKTAEGTSLALSDFISKATCM